jgi:hypothetical protein
MVTAQDIANQILFICSPAGATITYKVCPSAAMSSTSAEHIGIVQ